MKNNKLWLGLFGMLLLVLSSIVNAASYDSSLIQTYSVKGLEIKNETIDYIVTVEETGLNNAILRVRNVEAADILKRNLARLENKDKDKISELDGVIVTESKNGSIIIEGKQAGKLFGLIPGQITKKYVISSDGSLVEKRNLFHGFFKIQNSSLEAGGSQ